MFSLIISATRGGAGSPASSSSAIGSPIRYARGVLKFLSPSKCTLNETPNPPWPWRIAPEVIESFGASLARVATCNPASDHKTVVMTVVDRGFIEMLDSYVYHASKNANMNKILFISMDQMTHEILQLRKLESYLTTELGRLAAGHSGVHTGGWRRKGHLKFKMATVAVHLGYSALVTDLDITYFRDPFPEINCWDCDIEVQSDLDMVDSPPNAGFVFFRPTEKTKAYLRDLSGFLDSNEWAWDQAELQNRLQTHVYQHGLKRRLLPFETFAPGKINQEDLFMYYDPMTEILDKMTILHHIHLAYEGKIFRMREFGLWTSDENGYYSDKTTKYIVYDNPLESMKHMEWNVLDFGLKLAVLLNRKLILPKFHCVLPRKCPAERYGIKGKDHKCYCSILHHLVDVLHRVAPDLFTEFEKTHHDQFREHTFLRNSLVPDSVKESQTEPMIIDSEAMRLFPDLRNGVTKIFTPKNIHVGPSKEELLKWFSPMSHISVLRFTALYNNYQL